LIRKSYYKWRKRRNVNTKFCCSNECRKKSCTIELPKEIINLYNSGKSSTDIGKMFDVNGITIIRELRRMGIHIRSYREAFALLENPTKGKGHTEGAKEKIREANKRQFSNPENRAKHSSLQMQVIASGKINKISKIENLVAKFFDENNIKYIRQYLVRDTITGRYCATVDFFVGDKYYIEINGTYWHADPRFYPNGPVHDSQKKTHECYTRKVKAMQLMGIYIVEIWEDDIKKDLCNAVRTAVPQLFNKE